MIKNHHKNERYKLNFSKKLIKKMLKMNIK